MSNNMVLEVYHPTKESDRLVFKWGAEFQKLDLAERLECLTKIRIEMEKTSQSIAEEFSDFVSRHRFE